VDQQGPTVLVVDDEVHIRCVIGRKLEHAGYRVMLSSSAEEAQQLIAQQPPALLVTDLRMPGMDGLQLCRWLRERSDTSAIPIILVTGSVAISGELNEEVERLGLHTVSKPFSLRRLNGLLTV